MFSPPSHAIRLLYQQEEPEEISVTLTMDTSKSHRSAVRCLAFSVNRTLLALGYHHGPVNIFDTISGECLQTFRSSSCYTHSVAFSHDSTQLVSVTGDGTAEVWDVGNGSCVQILRTRSGYIYSAAFSNDAAYLASVLGDGIINIWDVDSGSCIQSLQSKEEFGDEVSSVAFSHDSTQLASALCDGTIKLWSISNGSTLQTLTGHKNDVISVSFSQDSTHLASASSDRTVKIWSPSTGACLQTIEVNTILRRLSFNSTGSRLLTDIGTLSLRRSRIPNAEGRVGPDAPNVPQFKGTGLSVDGAWISHNGVNMVWIPQEYRSSSLDCWIVSRTTIVIGGRSGQVWFCSIDPRDVRKYM